MKNQIEQIKDAIQVEPSWIQDTILQVLKKNNGKRFDKFIVRKINLALGWDSDDYWAGIRKTTTAGMTYLEWGTSYPERTSMLVAHQITNLKVDADLFVKNNLGYFQAKDERNVARSKITHDDLVALIDAAQEFQDAKEKLDKMLDYDGKFQADCGTLRKICGL